MNNFGHSFSQNQPADKDIEDSLSQMKSGFFREALQQLEKKKDDPGLNDNDMKELLFGITECYYKRLLNLRGLEVVRKTLPICEELGSQFGIGLCSYYLGNRLDAINNLTQALKTPEVQQSSWKQGKSLFVLAQCHYMERKQTEAIDYYKQTIDFCHKNKNPIGAADAHLWYGMFIAETPLFAGMKEAKTRINLPEVTNDLYVPNTFLLFYLDAKEIRQANEQALDAYNHLRTAAELVEKTGDYLTLGFAHRTLSWLDVLHGNRIQSKDELLKAAYAFDKLDNTFYAGNCYFALGLVNRQNPVFMLEAADYFGKAAASLENVETPSNISIGNAYLQQAHCLYNFGTANKEVSASTHPLIADSGISETFLKQSESFIKQAQMTYEKAISWFEKKIDRRVLMSIGPAELNLGKCLMFLGDKLKAREYFKKAEEHYEQAGRSDMAKRAGELAGQAWGE